MLRYNSIGEENSYDLGSISIDHTLTDQSLSQHCVSALELNQQLPITAQQNRQSLVIFFLSPNSAQGACSREPLIEFGQSRFSNR